MGQIKNIDRKQQIEDVAEKIVTQKYYGEILTYEYLEELIGYDRYDPAFNIVLTIAKELLVEYGYVLKCVLNEGYKILAPNEIAEEIIQKYFKQSTNKIRKANKIMQYTDRDLLDKSELKFFEQIESLVERSLEYSENTLIEAQAMLNTVKTKELGEVK